MHDDRLVVEARLERTLRERIRPAVHPLVVPLTVEVWHVSGEPVPMAEGLAAEYQPARIGDRWGPPWGTSWFRLSGAVPSDWSGRAVEAVVDLGFGVDHPGFSAEGLVYRPDGTVVKGLHPHNKSVRIGSPAAGGEPVLLYVEAAANPPIRGPVTALGDTTTAGSAPLYRLARAELAVFDETVWELVQDLDVLGGLMRELPVEAPRRWEILRACERALDALDLQDVGGTAGAARSLLARALAAPASASAHRVVAVGHAHIDAAWLWPVRETVRKVARTAANVVALMDEHPEFVFAMSQAQQLAWLKEDQPRLYERVKQKVEDGRFVPAGGMWVEPDTNLTGGESLARQLIAGKRFYLDEFGVETEDVWLPDSFGFTAALPQLIKLSGSRWFLTQKLSWSQFNKFPHHTFWWEGLDGSRVFTHLPPADTYSSQLSPAELAHASVVFAEKGAASRSLVPFGYGDGGGGPTREMLARARRLADLEGSPRVEIATPVDFFAGAQAEYPDAPVWVGELYLELHRGTYTSQVKTKQGNRRAEALLREAELWSAAAATYAGFAYPYDELDRIWKTVLLHQFHDILPGSSIAWVHREAEQAYGRVAAELGGIIDAALCALAGDPSGGTVAFNAAPHTRRGVPAGGAVPLAPEVPASGGVAVREHEGGYLLDNGVLRVTVDARGLITSVYDVAVGRESVPPGAAANLLQLHPDYPVDWDAWDVCHYYRNTVTDLTEADEVSQLVKDDAESAAVKVDRSFGSSTVEQVLTLRAGARRLDIETMVDWHEREKLLKVAFPLDVRADRSAAETQFGHVFRPTHVNTGWDAAKFEICAHRWLHVGEPGWGAAVVNDSTYGHDVTSAVRADGGTTTTVRLSLLRAPRFPDPETDQGTHRFRYALVPGATIGDAVREGHWFNLPERRVPGSAAVAPLVRLDNDAAVIEAVKLADDRRGDIVVRIYEAHGGRAATRLSTGFPLARAVATDLLERPLGDASRYPVTDGGVTLTLRPFQILTLRLTPEPSALPHGGQDA